MTIKKVSVDKYRPFVEEIFKMFSERNLSVDDGVATLTLAMVVIIDKAGKDEKAKMYAATQIAKSIIQSQSLPNKEYLN